MWKPGEENEAVEWDWVYAVSLVDLEDQQRRAPAFEYPVQAFRIGPLGLVAVGGEPFVEGQLQIKLHSPARRTIHCATLS